jgi:hypothetical protein
MLARKDETTWSHVCVEPKEVRLRNREEWGFQGAE